jgi:hypothetical protein
MTQVLPQVPCCTARPLADPAKYEAESAANGMHTWSAFDVPSAPGVCAGRAELPGGRYPVPLARRIASSPSSMDSSTVVFCALQAPLPATARAMAETLTLSGSSASMTTSYSSKGIVGAEQPATLRFDHRPHDFHTVLWVPDLGDPGFAAVCSWNI